MIATDEQDGSIGLQHFDGTLDEALAEDWINMRPEISAAPEDWSGSVDVNTEDLPDTAQPTVVDWQSQIEKLDYFDEVD